MSDTVTRAFTCKVASRDGDQATTECGNTWQDIGWIDRGTKCPTCYPGTIYPASPGQEPITYRRRSA